MPQGPGKYDDVCTLARAATGGEAVILSVINGNHGSGFSVQADANITPRLPAILRRLAADIEASFNV
jgi:hypothetical protein